MSAPIPSGSPPTDQQPGCLGSAIPLAAAGVVGFLVLGMSVAGAFGIAAGTGHTDAASGGTIMNIGMGLGALLGILAAYRVFRALTRP